MLKSEPSLNISELYNIKRKNFGGMQTMVAGGKYKMKIDVGDILLNSGKAQISVDSHDYPYVRSALLMEYLYRKSEDDTINVNIEIETDPMVNKI